MSHLIGEDLHNMVMEGIQSGLAKRKLDSLKREVGID
jgi:hypothetical protein